MSTNGQSISSSKLCYILGWVGYQNAHPDVVLASYKPGLFLGVVRFMLSVKVSVDW